jgi:hypothetical protein
MILPVVHPEGPAAAGPRPDGPGPAGLGSPGTACFGRRGALRWPGAPLAGGGAVGVLVGLWPPMSSLLPADRLFWLIGSQLVVASAAQAARCQVGEGGVAVHGHD